MISSIEAGRWSGSIGCKSDEEFFDGFSSVLSRVPINDVLSSGFLFKENWKCLRNDVAVTRRLALNNTLALPKGIDFNPMPRSGVHEEFQGGEQVWAKRFLQETILFGEYFVGERETIQQMLWVSNVVDSNEFQESWVKKSNEKLDEKLRQICKLFWQSFVDPKQKAAARTTSRDELDELNECKTNETSSERPLILRFMFLFSDFVASFWWLYWWLYSIDSIAASCAGSLFHYYSNFFCLCAALQANQRWVERWFTITIFAIVSRRALPCEFFGSSYIYTLQTNRFEDAGDLFECSSEEQNLQNSRNWRTTPGKETETSLWGWGAWWLTKLEPANWASVTN